MGSCLTTISLDHFCSAWLCLQRSWYGTLSFVRRPSSVFRIRVTILLRNYWIHFFQVALGLSQPGYCHLKRNQSFLISSSALLCQQSSWNRNSSVVLSAHPPSVRVAIISAPNVWISFKLLVVASPGPYDRDFVFDFWKTQEIKREKNPHTPRKKKQQNPQQKQTNKQTQSQNKTDFWFFTTFLVFVNTGEIPKCYPYKSLPKVVKLVLTFPHKGHNKTVFNLGIFEILSFQFFFKNVKFTIVSYGENKNLNSLEKEWL